VLPKGACLANSK